MPPRVTVLMVPCLIFLIGCDRQKAKGRVLEAVNPPAVNVINGQAAVLRLSNAFAVIIPTYIRHDEIRYRVFSNTHGDFRAHADLIREGVATTTTAVEVGGARVFVGYGGDNATSIMLDLGDKQTGISVFPTNDIRMLKASRMEFKHGKSFDPDDLMKAIGETSSPSGP